MKNYYMLAASALIAAMGASAATPTQFGFNQNVKSANVMKMVPAKSKVKAAGPLKSYDQPETEMIANEAGFTDYQDLYGNGTHVYWLYLSNAGLDDGDPLHDGQLLRVLLVAEETNDGVPTIPTGNFTCSDSHEAGTFVPKYTEFLDVFPHPDDPENFDLDNLVAWKYQPTEGEGSVKITKDGDNYLVRVNFEGTLWDTTGDEPQALDKRLCTAVYEGPIEYVEPLEYDPITVDTELNTPILKGGYYDGGDFELTFVSDGMLDKEGFVVGAGQIMNITILVEDLSPMPLQFLTGTMEGFDYTQGLKKNMWMKGFMYEIVAGYKVPMGTNLSLYNDEGNIDKTALCVDGTLSFTAHESGNTTISMDFISVEGKKITGSWTGNLKKNIIDMSHNAGVESIEAEDVVTGSSEVYTLSGVRVSAENMGSGIYLVRNGEKVSKVIVK